MARTKKVSYDEVCMDLLLSGEKPGSPKLRKLAQHAAQSLAGGYCPECGGGGEHEFNGAHYQCADAECLAQWEQGENVETVSELLEALS